MLQADDQRVLTVGDRLSVAASELCGGSARSIGIALHALRQYGPVYRDDARRLFALSDQPTVLAVAAGGPAERAGLRAGDAILAIDGAAVPPASSADGIAGIEAVRERLARAEQDGWVEIAFTRGATRMETRVLAVPACPVRFRTRAAAELDAETDGDIVEVTTGLVDFTRTPDELAVVIAHELAHDLLRHRARLWASGVWTSALPARERARLILATEIEADRLSVRLVVRAGYSTDAFAMFWTRMERTARGRRIGPGLHPSDRRRRAILQREIRALAAERPVATAPRVIDRSPRAASPPG